MRRSLLRYVALSLFAASLGHGSARAEGTLFHRRPAAIDPNCPGCVQPQVTPVPQSTTPMPEPKTPDTPVNPSIMPPAAEPTPDIAPMVSAALGDSSLAYAAPGYIDYARPMNQFRIRYDAMYDMNRPDRAEYFYGKCGCFGGNAPGPRRLERSVDAQDTTFYLELAPVQRFSVFIDVPIRAINPERNENATGLGDIRYGFKYAFIYDDTQIMTFQLRGFAPSGDARKGLGTSHNTLEPSILYMKQIGQNITVFGEFGDWIPLDGTDFAGNVLYYGVGVGYTMFGQNGFFVTPLAEAIGWTVLSGQELNPQAGAVSASGDQIINGKLGVRAGNQRHDVYVGYGRALTGEVWYQDIVRFEYRFKF
jgi:hypothetical protein